MTDKDEDKTPGGAREGSGRKVGYRKRNPKSRVINCRVTPIQYRKAQKIGNGFAGKGLRLALQAYRDNKK